MKRTGYTYSYFSARQTEEPGFEGITQALPDFGQPGSPLLDHPIVEMVVYDMVLP